VRHGLPGLQVTGRRIVRGHSVEAGQAKGRIGQFILETILEQEGNG